VGDRYRSLFVIGRGGMGSVEVALECSGAAFDRFDRVVALKTLLPDGARDPRHKEMFLREARLAALLQHPNVVHAFSFGELFGELFLAMEYVEGEPLSRVLASAQGAGGSRGLDPAIVARILAEACDGLHAAHELCDAGGQALHVVHRDVSPQNIMVAYDGHVKILDFGVAKVDAGGHWTRTGEVKGKMAYMSPEQALGEKLDRRSDLFSVGAILFECLTGERMWGSGTDLEVMRKLALEPPPRLDAAMPGVPAALVALHERLVARDPSQRPATAQEVARELRAFEAPHRPADPTIVRSLMRRLFASDEATRRAELRDALERVAPQRARALGEAFALRFDVQPDAEGTPSTEPVVVRAPVEEHVRAVSTRPGRLRSRLGLAVALGAAVAVGAGVTAGAMRRGAHVATAEVAPAPPSSPAANAEQPQTIVPAPPEAQTARERAMTPAAVTPRGGGVTRSPPKANAPAPGGWVRTKQPPSSSARPREGKPPGPKLPDVDPTPF